MLLIQGYTIAIVSDCCHQRELKPTQIGPSFLTSSVAISVLWASDCSTQTVIIKKSDSPPTVIGITAIAPQRLNHSIRHRELDETSSVTHWTLEDPSHSHNHACSSCCSWTMLWISPHGVKYCMCSWVHVCVSICFLQSGLCCPATLDHTLFLLIRGCTVGEIDMMLSTTD